MDAFGSRFHVRQRLLFGIGALLVLSLAAPAASQQDLGFRYRLGKCVNEAGEEGLNPEYPGECGDVSGIDLRNTFLENAIFSGANLRGARLNSANLRGAVFTGADLRSADFRNADASGADFREATATRANFGQAVITGANFESINMQRAILHQAIARRAIFRGADLRSVDIRGTDLTDADLTGTRLRRAVGDAETRIPANVSYQELMTRGVFFR